MQLVKNPVGNWAHHAGFLPALILSVEEKRWGAGQQLIL